MTKGLTLLASLGLCNAALAAKEKPAAATVTNAPAPVFAPVALDHPLAAIWNDPVFARQLLGSYGFAAEVEPRLTAEEQQFWRDKVVPLLRGDANKALAELLPRVKPDASALFDFTVGNLYFQAEDTTNAVKFFEQATAKHPSFRRAWKQWGLALVRDGQFELAIAPLARSLALGDVDGKAYGLLAFANLSAGKHVSAEAAYRQAILLEPDNADFKLGLVKALVAQANYDGALALLDELLRLQPDKEALWTIQANVFLQQNQPARAAVNFEVLRRLDKITADQLATLGDIYMTQEARDLALEAYLAAMEKDGGQKPGRALRAADILVQRGAHAEARALFAKIRATTGAGALPEAEEMRLLKLEARTAMATGAGAEAIQVLERIITRNPLDGEALLLAGDYYARSGDVERAEFRFNAAAKLEQYAPDAYVKQAQLLVRGAKYAQAVEVLKKAQRAKPRDNVQRYLERVEQLARGRS